MVLEPQPGQEPQPPSSKTSNFEQDKAKGWHLGNGNLDKKKPAKGNSLTG